MSVRRIDGFAADLFRCHARHRADGTWPATEMGGRAVSLPALFSVESARGGVGQPEVQDLHARRESPSRWQVSGRGGPPPVHAPRRAHRPAGWHSRRRAPSAARRCDHVAQVLAFDQFHRDEGDAVLLLNRMEDDDVGMIQPGDSAGLRAGIWPAVPHRPTVREAGS